MDHSPIRQTFELGKLITNHCHSWNEHPKFSKMVKSIQNSQTSHDCIFHILRYFSTKLHNFTKFRMFFQAVLMNFPNSKVCLIGEWSIDIFASEMNFDFYLYQKVLSKLVVSKVFNNYLCRSGSYIGEFRTQ